MSHANGRISSADLPFAKYFARRTEQSLLAK
jgi:hypothetical protein